MKRKKITHKEAKASFDNLFKYLEDSEDLFLLLLLFI